MQSHLVWLLLTIALFIAGTRMQKESHASDRKASIPSDQNLLSSQPNHSPDSNASSSLSNQTRRAKIESKSELPGIPFTNPWAARFPSRTPSTPPGNPSNSTTGPIAEGTTAENPKAKPTLSKDQIQRLVQNTLKDPSPIARRLAFDQLLASLDESTAIEIRTALALNKAGGEQWRLFDYAWSAGDPTVVETNLPNTAEQHQKGFISNSLPGWAFADPLGAAEFVNDYEPGPVQDHFRNRLVEGLADNDIGMATDFVLEIATEDQSEAQKYIRTVAREVIESKSPVEAQIWIDTLPEGPLRNSALSALPKATPVKPSLPK